MQVYSDPKRADDPYALPDVEVFYLDGTEEKEDAEEPFEAGWYYWYCFPGCLSESGPFGPYASPQEAEAAAQEDALDY